MFIDVAELFVGTPVPGCPPDHGAVLHRTTKYVIPRSPRGRGNLLLGSKMPHYPIHIEHPGYSMLIGVILKYSAVPEIATGINALAMTGVVDGRQHLTDRATN